MEVDFSLPSKRITRALDQVIQWRGKSKAIRCDNGPESISDPLTSWAEKRGVELQYIQPGKPRQNAYVERYNRTVRYEWLNQHLFESMEPARKSATQWLWTVNNERPNRAIGGIPPVQKRIAAYPLLLTSVSNGGITVSPATAGSPQIVPDPTTRADSRCRVQPAPGSSA